MIAPSSTEGRDGLGPLFQATSCSGCHFKDGRGHPPEDGRNFVSLILRLSVPGAGPHGAPRPHPNYGDQFQPRGIPGVPPEGEAIVTYEPVHGAFGDGWSYELMRPHYQFASLAYGALGTNVLISPRVAPSVFGLGLLSAIPENDVLNNADPKDKDGDGISGRPNRVWNMREKKKTLGRFGWKANQPTTEQQDATAFHGDIGITSELFPDQNCMPGQSACASAPDGGTPELTPLKLKRVTDYIMRLAVPARRGWTNDLVRVGEGLFRDMKCNACHVSDFITGNVPGKPELSRQAIHPFTDLLLHDMGEGLADGRPDFEASGSEWRTAPLWGIGLTQTVNGHTRFLHDGRARNLQEAILWHGGEAESAKVSFRKLSWLDRQAVLSFLDSL